VPNYVTLVIWYASYTKYSRWFHRRLSASNFKQNNSKEYPVPRNRKLTAQKETHQAHMLTVLLAYTKRHKTAVILSCLRKYQMVL